MSKQHRGFSYYGEILSLYDLRERGIFCPISTNGMQGDDGMGFIVELSEYDVAVEIDYEDSFDGASQVFVTFNETISMDAMMDVFTIMARARPNEFDRIGHTVRIWWD